jgi:alpha-galactosidase
MNRREFLGLAALPLAQAFGRQPLRALGGRVIAAGGADAAGVDLVSDWAGNLCRPHVLNRTSRAIRIKQVVLFDLELSMPPETVLYGEGFQMLTQTVGTLAEPVDLSQYTDAKHYRIPVGEGRAYYGLLTLTPPAGETHLFAFTSCARFSGRFELRQASVAEAFVGHRLRGILDTENLTLAPGETWALEELMVASGTDRSALLADVASRLSTHHQPLAFPAPPTGWCSWYCFGPNVTAQQVLDNLDVIARSMPALKYVQIDDGYQSAMGDWLDTGAAFGGNIRTVLAAIKRRGFEPAIWVAPFIAEEKSAVFERHPDWFVEDAGGAPLRSDRVTFGGWRRGPWYALDGTHPAVQDHLARIFRTMREEWGCTYFKLDANFWGAIHGGRFHDPHATRIEAYRRGMQAIRRGAGDSFILGCNHPIWPSAGLIHGSRSSNDIKRTWERIATTGRQNLSRNWQNGRLWWNDPDAIVLASDLTDAECLFHATAIYASGGMVLSGDDLTKLPPARAAMLRKLLPPTGVAAAFEDATLRVGVVTLPGARMMCLFNWDDRPETLSVRLPAAMTITDYWTDQPLGPEGSPEALRYEAGSVLRMAMPPRSARLLNGVL